MMLYAFIVMFNRQLVMHSKKNVNKEMDCCGLFEEI